MTRTEDILWARACDAHGVGPFKMLRWRVGLWLRRFDSWIELGASGFTLAGMYVGSTTVAGASLYLVSLVFWYALVYRQKLHGIIPLNVASTGVALLNIWRAL